MEHGGSDPTRNLALELARVTEAGALAAGRFKGRGDKEAADQVVRALRRREHDPLRVLAPHSRHPVRESL